MTTEAVIARFDPSRHMSKLSRRAKNPAGGWTNVEMDYLEVKWRLLWLRTEHPDADIVTELKQLDLDRNLAIVQASVPDGGRQTLRFSPGAPCTKIPRLRPLKSLLRRTERSARQPRHGTRAGAASGWARPPFYARCQATAGERLRIRQR